MKRRFAGGEGEKGSSFSVHHLAAMHSVHCQEPIIDNASPRWRLTASVQPNDTNDAENHDTSPNQVHHTLTNYYSKKNCPLRNRKDFSSSAAACRACTRLSAIHVVFINIKKPLPKTFFFNFLFGLNDSSIGLDMFWMQEDDGHNHRL